MSNYLPSQWTATTNQDSNTLLVGTPQQSYFVENAQKSWSFSNPGGDNSTLRFELRPGDHWSSAAWTDPSTSERDEISASTRIPVGTSIHISYDFMLEPGAANHASWMVIGQMHQASSSWSPPFDIEMVGEKMAIKIDAAGNQANSWSQYKTLWIDPQNIVRGETYHLDINVKFDATSGHLDVSRDGVQLVNYNGPLGWGADMGSYTYWKEGVYRSASDTTVAADYSHLSITTGDTATTPTTPTAPTSPTAPAAPTGLSDAAIVGGYVNAAHDTASQSLTGSAAAGSSVTVYDGSTKLGVVAANSSGQWSYTLGHLADGSHSLTATAADAAGHVSAASSALHFTVDTQAPGAPTGLADSAVVNGLVDAAHNTTSQALTGSAAAGSSVTVYDGSTKLGVVAANSSGQWSYTLGHLADGSHSLSATATDAAGNVGAASNALQFSVDSLTSTPPASTGSVINGGRWSDNLTGTSGDDTIAGGSGNDTITGAAGNDVITGGSGGDHFVFGAGFGHDTITDFNRRDELVFQGVGKPTYTDTANGIVFHDDAGDTVLLKGVHSISSHDWVVM